MKFQPTVLSLTLFLAAALTPELIASSPASSQTTSFYCGTFQGSPATIAKTPRGEVVIVKWVSTLGSHSPQSRCQIVSSRFQKSASNGTLKYLTTGKINQQSVICIASRRGGPCIEDGLLFTLKPGSKPKAVLQDLLNTSRYASGPFLNESTTPCIPKKSSEIDQERGTTDLYVDVDAFLNQCPE